MEVSGKVPQVQAKQGPRLHVYAGQGAALWSKTIYCKIAKAY